MGEGKSEGSLYGPFSGGVSAGELMVIPYPAIGKNADVDECNLKQDASWKIERGTTVQIISDRVTDPDEWHEFRNIKVQFVDGPHIGKTGFVERIYLRRKP